MDVAACHYIVVEGPIGAGKTSLARELALRLHADTLLELPEENPFLARFYEDMARFALPTQLNFLFQRVDQLRALAQLDMFRRPTVADFLLDKDPLFARLNLSDDEYALYDKVYQHLKPQTPTPDLVIYLQAPVATLVERVQRRGVDYERAIPRRLPRAARRCIHALLLPVRRGAAADRQQRAAQLRRQLRALRAAGRAHRVDARPPRVLQPGGTDPHCRARLSSGCRPAVIARPHDRALFRGMDMMSKAVRLARRLLRVFVVASLALAAAVAPAQGLYPASRSAWSCRSRRAPAPTPSRASSRRSSPTRWASRSSSTTGPARAARSAPPKSRSPMPTATRCCSSPSPFTTVAASQTATPATTRCAQFVAGRADRRRARSPSSSTSTCRSNTLREFLALARREPGRLNYGSAGAGSVNHLALELLQRAHRRRHRPRALPRHRRRDEGPAGRPDPGDDGVDPGDVAASWPSTGQGARRHRQAPRRADARRAELAGGRRRRRRTCINYWGIVAPAGTPPAIVARLNGEVSRLLAQPDVIATPRARRRRDDPRARRERLGALIADDLDNWRS